MYMKNVRGRKEIFQAFSSPEVITALHLKKETA